MLMAKDSLYPSPFMIMHSMVPELKLWHEGRRIMCLSTGTGHCNSAKVCCNQAFVGNFCGEPSSWEDQYAVLRYSYIIARVLCPLTIGVMNVIVETNIMPVRRAGISACFFIIFATIVPGQDRQRYILSGAVGHLLGFRCLRCCLRVEVEWLLQRSAKFALKCCSN